MFVVRINAKMIRRRHAGHHYSKGGRFNYNPKPNIHVMDWWQWCAGTSALLIDSRRHIVSASISQRPKRLIGVLCAQSMQNKKKAASFRTFLIDVDADGGHPVALERFASKRVFAGVRRQLRPFVHAANAPAILRAKLRAHV